MPDHSRTFALITLRGLADMLADAADKIAAQSPKAQAIIDTNTRPVTGYGMAGCAQVFQNLDSTLRGSFKLIKSRPTHLQSSTFCLSSLFSAYLVYCNITAT